MKAISTFLFLWSSSVGIAMLSYFFLSVSSDRLFQWRKVSWIGQVESPVLEKHSKWERSSIPFKGNERAVIKEYTALTREISRLKPFQKKYSEKLVESIETIKQPKKKAFGSFQFKDQLSENIKYMDKAHGLFSNNVVAILESELGYIWIGTENDGLFKTNGKDVWNFKIEHGMHSNSVSRLFKDSKKVIWICWDKGISFIKEGKIHHIKNEKINNIRITRVREDKHHTIWITSDGNGLFKLKDNGLEVFNQERGLSSDSFDDVSFLSSGEMFAASLSGGLNIIRKDSVEIIRDVERNYPNFSPIALLQSKDKLWIGSFTSNSFYYKNGKIYSVVMNGQYDRCYDIHENDFGIWFSGYGTGVKLLRRDGKIQNYTLEKGLAGMNSIGLCIDHQNNVWVADPFSGLSLINVSPFRSIASLGNSVTAFSLDQFGNKWFSSNGKGVSALIENQIKLINVKPGPKVYQIYHSWDILPVSDGSFWISTHGNGVARLQRENYDYFHFEKGNIITDICKGVAGDVWFSTPIDGLRKWDSLKKEFRLYSKKDGLTSNNVRSCTLDNENQLWICTDRGISILKGNTICVLNKSNGLSSDDINRVTQDAQGRMWVSTNDRGIDIVYQDEIKNLNEDRGLINNRVLNVFHSSRKESWVITASGLTKVAKFGEIDAKLTNYSYDHGSFMLDFTGAAIEESDGRIMFGTNREYVEYDPYFLHKGSSSPKFIMESISIDNKRLSADKGSIQVLNTAQLRLEYSVLNWGQNTVKKCKYALLERNSQDTIWISTQLNTPIILNSLNSGDYQFLLRVKEGDAEVVFKGQKFAFIPPWYRSIWAFLSFAILAIVLINFVVRFRLRYLQLKQIELEGIVEHRTVELKKEKAELFRLNKKIEKAMEEKDVVIYEMHHRVKNNLQTISTLLDLQIRTLKNKDGILALQDAIRRITAMSSSHELLYSSDDLTHINLKSFIAHLIHSQEQIFQNTQNKCELEFEIEDFDIDVSSCISLGMIVSEIVSNSIKHAFIQVENPKIVFKATQREGQCCFSVEDNGVGLSEDVIEEQPKSLGLRLIRIFVAKLKGKYVMENINPGLKIMVTFPIKSVETKEEIL